MELRSKTILITGSTDGVGRRVAQRLAGSGATVLIHGRNRDRGESLLREIRRGGGSGTFHCADFSSLSGVRALAQAIQGQHGSLDVLINNAGIGVGHRGSGRELSQDGHELRFAVNYLAGFLLTHLLLPLLKKSPAARIVNVASIGQQPIDFNDLMLAKGYSGARAYCQSKLAQVMFTFDLARELDGSAVVTNCLHPATYMDTAMVRKDGITPMSSVDEGADAILHLAADAATARTNGLYFDGLLPRRADAMAYDAAARARLRSISIELAGLPPSPPDTSSDA